LPNAVRTPTGKVIVDCLVRTLSGRAIFQAAANFQNMHDPAQYPVIIIPLTSRLVCWQMWSNLFLLLLAEVRLFQTPCRGLNS
jgi:hypothetical protein